MATQTDYTDPVDVMRARARIHFATRQRQREAEMLAAAQHADDLECDRLDKIVRLVLENGGGYPVGGYVDGVGSVDAYVARQGDEITVLETTPCRLLGSLTPEQVAAALDEPVTCPEPNNPDCRCGACAAVLGAAKPLLTDDDAIYNATIDAFELPDDEPIRISDGRRYHLPSGVPTSVFPASVPGMGLDGGDGPVKGGG